MSNIAKPTLNLPASDSIKGSAPSVEDSTDSTNDIEDSTTVAESTTHLTLTSGSDDNVLTNLGRKGLRTNGDMPDEEIDDAVARLRTVTLQSGTDHWGCRCLDIFEGLLDVAKSGSLQLKSVMIRHVYDPHTYEKKKPMNPYRTCAESLPLRAESYIILNEYEGRSVTFIISTAIQSTSNADPTTLRFAELRKADREVIHFGLLNRPEGEWWDGKVYGGVVPDFRYMSIFSDLASQTAPRSVTLVDIVVDKRGSMPSEQSDQRLIAYNINEDGARAKIEERIQREPGEAALRQREGDVGTEYTFVGRNTFWASQVGQRLLAHLDAR